MVVIKRSNRDDDVESLAMANCLMLISQMDQDQLAISSRVYECKTCRKKFHSFQALGGHRASHKRPRILDGYGHCLRDDNKKHVCTVCGLEFERGQALGGHMSKHRTHSQQLPVEDNNSRDNNNNNNNVNFKSADYRHSGSTVVVKEQQEQEEDTSSESIKEAAAKAMVAWDLNLTPFQNEINELILATD